MPNSIPMSWLYILTEWMRVSSSFSFFANCFMLSMYIRLLIFSCDLLSLYQAVHFLSICLSGIIAIMNSKGDSASPWNIPLWVFVSAKLLPPAVYFTFLVFMIKFMTLSDILYIFRQLIIQALQDVSYAFLLSFQAIARFFRLVLLLLRMCWSMESNSSVYLDTLRHLFCSYPCFSNKIYLFFILWKLNEIKSSLVSRNCLIILANLYSLDDFHSSSDLPFSLSLFWAFKDRSKGSLSRVPFTIAHHSHLQFFHSFLTIWKD